MINYIMTLLTTNTSLQGYSDNNIMTSLPEIAAVLSGTHKTVIGVDDTVQNTTGIWRSEFRSANKTTGTVQIQVLSSYGNNSDYCSMVVDYICGLISDNCELKLANYRLLVQSISPSIDVVESKWLGTINVVISQFDTI
jgi:hypothetical protein